MAYFNRQSEYKLDKPIIAFAEGVSAPFSVTLKASDYGLNYNSDVGGKKFYPAGHFIYRDPNGDARILPRARVVEVVGTPTASSLTLTVTNPYVFKVNDVVSYFLYGHVTNDFSLPLEEPSPLAYFSYANSNHYRNYSINVRVLAAVSSVNVQNNTVTLNRLSAASAHALNDTNHVAFLASGFFSISPSPVVVLTAEKAEDQFTVLQIGSSSYEYLQPLDPRGSILGLVPHAIDLESGPTTNVAVVSKANGVYKNALPYCDIHLENYLSDLNIKERF